MEDDIVVLTPTVVADDYSVVPTAPDVEKPPIFVEPEIAPEEVPTVVSESVPQPVEGTTPLMKKAE
jgi:hypothetical protein